MRPLMISDHNPQTSAVTDVLWESLLSATDSPTLVVEPQGIIRRANPMARSIFGLEEGSPVMALRGVLQEASAEELLKHIRAVDDSGTPLIVDGVLRGRWLRMTLRPCEHEGVRCVLIAGSLSHEGETPDDLRRVRMTRDDAGKLAALTPREMEILKLIALGLPTSDIAKVLYRSVKTIEGHRVSLGTKLQITNRVELARIALRSGLITLDTPVPTPPQSADD